MGAFIGFLKKIGTKTKFGLLILVACFSFVAVQPAQAQFSLAAIMAFLQNTLVNQVINQTLIQGVLKDLLIRDVLGIGGNTPDISTDLPGSTNDTSIKQDVVNSTNEVKRFLIEDLFENAIQPALQAMTEQLTITMLYQAQLIGAMMDAQTQLDTQRTLQQLMAQAQKDYLPSEALCKFGTNVRSLAMSEHKATINQIALSERMQNRQTENQFQMTVDGGSDIASRWKQFTENYCDKSDLNGALGSNNICKASTGKPERLNRDIDFTRTIDSPLTLNINFGRTTKTGATATSEKDSKLLPSATGYNEDTKLSADEEDVLAFANNLYASKLFDSFSAPELKAMENGCNAGSDSEGPCRKLILFRSVIAKRSVAMNSFNAITAMKSEGSGAANGFLSAAIQELGFDGDGKTDLQNIERYLGTNPSYHAQMEVLTKKLYQNPNFYVNLIDKPANVARQQAAMQAFGLMQDRDIYNSLLRQEMLLSVMLELELQLNQNEIINAGR